jgi:chemotaxis protein CheX
MDVKLVNPFIEAFTTVMSQMGFPEPQRKGLGVKEKVAENRGVSVVVGFTKHLQGNVVYNMSEDTAKYIASVMMGSPVQAFDAISQSAISEMSNMLTANAATNMASLGVETDISTPDMNIMADVEVGQEQYLAVDMGLADHSVEIDIAIAAS